MSQPSRQVPGRAPPTWGVTPCKGFSWLLRCPVAPFQIIVRSAEACTSCQVGTLRGTDTMEGEPPPLTNTPSYRGLGSLPFLTVVQSPSLVPSCRGCFALLPEVLMGIPALICWVGEPRRPGS